MIFKSYGEGITQYQVDYAKSMIMLLKRFIMENNPDVREELAVSVKSHAERLDKRVRKQRIPIPL